MLRGPGAARAWIYDFDCSRQRSLSIRRSTVGPLNVYYLGSTAARMSRRRRRRTAKNDRQYAFTQPAVKLRLKTPPCALSALIELVLSPSCSHSYARQECPLQPQGRPYPASPALVQYLALRAPTLVNVQTTFWPIQHRRPPNRRGIPRGRLHTAPEPR
jgi:hypothetical protein